MEPYGITIDLHLNAEHARGGVHVTLVILSMGVYNAYSLECARIIKTSYNTCCGSGGWVCAHGRARFCFTASKGGNVCDQGNREYMVWHDMGVIYVSISKRLVSHSVMQGAFMSWLRFFNNRACRSCRGTPRVWHKTRVVHSAMKATMFSLHECSNRLVPCDTVEKPATTNQLVLALDTACAKFAFLC